MIGCRRHVTTKEHIARRRIVVHEVGPRVFQRRRGGDDKAEKNEAAHTMAHPLCMDWLDFLKQVPSSLDLG
jgi:hypothetical protein